MNGKSELYDLGEDPEETKNLASQHPRRMSELEKKLKAWLSSAETSQEAERYEYDDEGLKQHLKSLGYL